jgi:hypothetical protein
MEAAAADVVGGTDMDVASLSVKELKDLIKRAGMSLSSCVEKSDLIAQATIAKKRLQETSETPSGAGANNKKNKQKSKTEKTAIKHPSYDSRVILMQCPWLGQFPLIKPENRPQLGYFVEQMIQRDFEDFTWATDFDPYFLADLMRHGFLTMATDVR